VTSVSKPELALATPRVNSRGYVYFIQEGKRGPVKIGWTESSPAARLELIQSNNPRPLHLRRSIATAVRGYERELHTFYAEHRITREWFRPLVLEIEPPQPPDAGDYPPVAPSNLLPRLCRNCGEPWEAHLKRDCLVGWMPPEARRNSAEPA
jgi:Meiotically Up-regulated Gene 113 (MUG113) protein